MFSCHNRENLPSKRGRNHDSNQTDEGRAAFVITVSHNYGWHSGELEGVTKVQFIFHSFHHSFIYLMIYCFTSFMCSSFCALQCKRIHKTFSTYSTLAVICFCITNGGAEHSLFYTLRVIVFETCF